ncbi:MAG: DUF6421 family protein [Chthoniobacter sp.]|nr:DUF6421 family protein [Chthoniobacter sp.]
MPNEPRKIARVLFDESHSESWTVSAERATEMQPENPANSSYQRAAGLLAARDFTVARNLAEPLEAAALAGTDVLALLHPCDPRWERTTSRGALALAAGEVAAILAFVRAGGGLLVVTEYEHDKYGDNFNELLAPAGLRIENGTAFDRTACIHENAEWLFGEPDTATTLAHGVSHACFYRASWVVATGPDAQLAWKTSPRAYPPEVGLIATARLGAGRIVVVTDSVLFGDERLGAYGHEQLWLNIIHWLAAPVFARPDAPDVTATPAAWGGLKSAINQLRARQLGDGSVPAAEHATAAPLVAQALAACVELRPYFPHQADYLDQLARDFRAWVAGGFARPDFGAALAAFHPERDRHDGREHLVVFPMYTPNASRETRFEAILMRTPWPGWLAALERIGYRNAKFAPGHLVDFTDGYASECAVLFPETVALAANPSNHFATIFCDREACRLQSYARRAAAATGLALFPELECWLGSRVLIEDTTALWDLIHDASHSLGELPFDPFMIRQRAPFWMYGIEELRVDLRSFEEAARLVAEGFPFARYVQWAIVLDRVFRFPLTGPRVRNYDALGGQLLFAYLHQHDALIWRDNRLTIRWDAVATGIRGLREELAALYKFGVDCSKLTFWLTAHRLISRYVPPNVASHWQAGAREINDERDLKKWLDLVHEDEFPLGNFHLNLLRRI